MNDIINNSIDYYIKKGKNIEVIRRFIRLKYRISIDSAALHQRIKHLRLNYELQ